jgi:hypothetical protein
LAVKPHHLAVKPHQLAKILKVDQETMML